MELNIYTPSKRITKVNQSLYSAWKTLGITFGLTSLCDFNGGLPIDCGLRNEAWKPKEKPLTGLHPAHTLNTVYKELLDLNLCYQDLKDALFPQ